MQTRLADGDYLVQPVDGDWVIMTFARGRLAGSTTEARSPDADIVAIPVHGSDRQLVLDHVPGPRRSRRVQYMSLIDPLPAVADRRSRQRRGQSWSSPQEMDSAAPGDWRHGEVQVVDAGCGPFFRVWHDGEAVWYTV